MPQFTVERQLAHRLVRLDAGAIETFERRLRDHLSSGVGRRIAPWLREDLVAAVAAVLTNLLATEEGRRRLAEVEDLGSWFGRIIQRQLVNIVRRVRTAGAAAAEPSAPGRTPSGEILVSEIRSTLRLLISKLRPEDRRVLTLYHLEGLQGAEFASRLIGSATEAAQRRALRQLRSAEKHLRVAADRHGFRYP